MQKEIIFNISFKAIIKILLAILFLLFLYLIRDILLLVFVVLIVVAGLGPTLIYFDKYKIPRWLSVTIVYILILAFLVLLFFLIIPPVIEQSSLLIKNIPFIIEKLPSSISEFISNNYATETEKFFSLSENLKNISNSVMEYTFTFFGSVSDFVLISIISFYLLLKQEAVEETFFSFFPDRKKEHMNKIYNKINQKLGKWIRSRVLLSFIITIITFIVLSLINVPYAMMLAVLAGILDIVPIIGPVFTGLVIGIIAYTTGSVWLAGLSVILFTLIIQFADNFIAPKLMGKAIGLSPVIIIIVFTIGAKLGGIIGAVLAIPFAAGIYVLIEEWESFKKAVFN